jgi:hypothetical protein
VSRRIRCLLTLVAVAVVTSGCRIVLDESLTKNDGGPTDAGSCVMCGDTCVDLLTSFDHCGSCSHLCPPPQSCSAGECVPLDAGSFDAGPRPDAGDLEGRVRLVPGPARGRLEVHHDGSWGTVCDDIFGEPDARVACRELGYTSGSSFTDGSWSGTIWMDDVTCTGTEDRLTECGFRGWGMHNCTHSEDVGVSCL